MAKVIIIVTNKSTYHAFWDSAASFRVLSSQKNPLKYVQVDGDGAYLLAEFESSLSPQVVREREVRKQTTHRVIQLAKHELTNSQESGGGPPEIYAAAHKPRVNWEKVTADPRVGGLFAGFVDFSHDTDNLIYQLLKRFVSAPTRETYDAVVDAVAKRVVVQAPGGGGKTALEAVHAFRDLKHRLVGLLRQVAIDLQGLERTGFPPEYKKIIAAKYEHDAPALLEDLRKNVYDADTGLLSVVRRARGWATGPRAQAIAEAWSQVEDRLPQQGQVSFTVGDGPPGSVTDILSRLGDEEGLNQIRKTGGVRLFNEWYHALDDAFDDVRKAIEGTDEASRPAPESAACAAPS
jgi:hypothetical protein